MHHCSQCARARSDRPAGARIHARRGAGQVM